MRVSTVMRVMLLVGSFMTVVAPDALAQAVDSDIPIQVRAIATTPAGVQATLVNSSAHVLTTFEAVLQVPRGMAGDQVSATSQSGLQWQPSTEVVVLFPVRPAPIDGQVMVRAAIGAGGEEYGDPDTLRRHRNAQQARATARADVLTLLQAQGAPATEDALQALVERVALAMARAPKGAANDAGLQVYTSVIATLKQWQARRLAGTSRMGLEMRGLVWQLGPDADVPR